MSLPGAQQTRHFEVRLPWDKRRGTLKGGIVREWMYRDMMPLREPSTHRHDSTYTYTYTEAREKAEFDCITRLEGTMKALDGHMVLPPGKASFS